MADLLMPPFKKVKQEEPEEFGVKLNDLPELPFEKILGYLSLEDRIKSRAVSRRWCNVIDSFKPTSLGYSDRPKGFIRGNRRWITGAFAQSFINSPRFASFFQTFGHSILTKLKQLRLFKLDLSEENTRASFVQVLASFGQLEELGLFDVGCSSELDAGLQLNLPMLKSVWLEGLYGIQKWTLDAPRLQKVKHWTWSKVELVHNEPVEKRIIGHLDAMEVKKMKNLRVFYRGLWPIITQKYSTLLSTLEQLEEIYLIYEGDIEEIFEQKKRYGRSNLKIFFLDLELNSRDDPAIAIGALDISKEEYLPYLAEHSSRLAEEIPCRNELQYSAINGALELEIDLLNRFTDLTWMAVSEPIKDVDRFLNLLKNLTNFSALNFGRFGQPQELFDRLPDHCPIQSLEIENAPEDLDFVFKLKSLIHLNLSFSIEIEFVQNVLEDLPFLKRFNFQYLTENFSIEIDHSKQFHVWFGKEKLKCFSGANAVVVVQWIIENVQE